MEEMRHMERRFEDFVRATNSRLDENGQKLDLLIDLTKHMAILQAQQDHNAENLIKLEKVVMSNKTEIFDLFKALDVRLAKLADENAIGTRRIYERMDETHKESDRKCDDCVSDRVLKEKELATSIQSIEKIILAFQTDYDKRVSFFRGIFFTFFLFSTIAQGILYRFFGDIEQHISQNSVEIQKMHNKDNESERQMDLIQNQLRSLRK